MTRRNGKQLTADDMLAVWGSGHLSGIVTTLHAFGGVPSEVASEVGRKMMDDMMTDPAVRETVLASIRANLEGETPTGLFASIPVYPLPRGDGS